MHSAADTYSKRIDPFAAPYFTDRRRALQSLLEAPELETLYDYSVKSIRRGGQGLVSLGVNRDGMVRALKTSVNVADWRSTESRLRDEAFLTNVASKDGNLFSLPMLDVLHQRDVSGVTCFHVVTPFCWMGSLEDRLKAEPLNGAEVLCILAGLAVCLDDIHSLGIGHFDVKPSNVLYWDGSFADIKVDGYGKQLVLCDFGSACFLDQSSSFLGLTTPAYTSPEILQGEDPGSPADIWCWGVIATELILNASGHHGSNGLGERPAFSVQSDQEIRKLLESLEATAACWLIELAARALSREAFRRPTAREILDVLQSRICFPISNGFIGSNPASAEVIWASNERLGTYLHWERDWPIMESD